MHSLSRLPASLRGAFLLAALCAAPGFSQDEAAPAEDLPLAGFTAEQAEAGELAYRQSCLSCHGSNLNNGTFGPPLKGRPFREDFFDVPASVLFAYVTNAMPPNAPGSLQHSAYAGIIAYIMQENGIEAGDTPLPSNAEELQELLLARPE